MKKQSKSKKTAVIRKLFFDNWNAETKTLEKSVMSLDDVKAAIRACNELTPDEKKPLSDRNPANFLKDVVRSRGASAIWPEELLQLGYRGAQRTGGGDSFEFVEIVDADATSEAFPDLHRPSSNTPQYQLQSVSLPEAAKMLGRRDEAWLTQTAVKLHVIEQYLATVSSLDVREITHLQMNVKLRATEIDSIYLASIGPDRVQALVTCEAKNDSERILEDQLVQQAIAAFGTKGVEVEMVVPLAIRSMRNVGIHVMEFKSVSREELAGFVAVEFVADAVFKLVPSVTGI